MKYILDGVPLTPVLSDVCCGCKHLQDVAKHTCTAFPKGIPKVIWNGLNLHRQPYPGDHDIQFEPVEKKVLTQA